MENKNLNQEIFFIIPENLVGTRVDKALAEVPEIQSRSRALHLIDQGCVLLSEKTVKASYKVQLGDKLKILIPPPEPTGLQSFDFRLDVVFEDSDVIVINKPSGLVVHPAAGHAHDTLVNALLSHTKNLSMKFGEERPGIVHRLDKETSGLLVVAKNDFAHESLTLQFKERSTHRIYNALCIGTAKNLSGTIQSYLARHPVDRKRYASVRGEDRKILTSEAPSQVGKWAVTHYTVLARKGGLSYLQLKLETGRTHQIRVHMSESGLPIMGDELYGAGKKINNIEAKQIRTDVLGLDRFLLHATELGFTHPRTQERLNYKVDWPTEIRELLTKWGF